MGGDCSQKLSPGGESHSSPGHSQPSAQLKINTLPQKTFSVRPRTIRPRAMKQQPPRRVSFSRNPFILPEPVRLPYLRRGNAWVFAMLTEHGSSRSAASASDPLRRLQPDHAELRHCPLWLYGTGIQTAL